MRTLCALLVWVPASAGNSWTPIQAETEAGNVTGRLGGGSLMDHCVFDPFAKIRTGSPDVATFYGIPYAQAPTGSLRFKPPQSRLSWSPKILDATHVPPICPQSVALPHEPWLPHWLPGFSTDEDCLTLNVWTRAPFSSASGDLRPVFAYIHGGGFIGGNGYQQFGCGFYDGNSLAANDGLVVTTMNYRLGSFGFLDLPELRAESGTAGNYGIQDQRLALKWIQKNIANFGGDPDQVTIVGESAGAVSVLHHVVLARSQGLFSRAVSQSPYFNFLGSGSDAQKRGAAFVEKAECTGENVLECLRTVSIDKLLDAQDSSMPKYFAGALQYYPVADGYELPIGETLMTAYSEIKSTKHVPVLIGSNMNETSFFQCGQLKENLGHQDAVQVILDMVYVLTGRNITAADADRLLANYPSGSYPSPRSAVIEAVTDVMFTCPVRRVSESLGSAATNKVYRYLLGRSPWFFREASSCLGVPHIADTFFVFYNDVLGKAMDAGDKVLANAMQGVWAAFARGEDPTLPANFSSEAWPKWDNAQEKTFWFDESPVVVAKYHDAGCDVVHDVIWQFNDGKNNNFITI